MTRLALVVAISVALAPDLARADDGVGALRVGGGTALFGWSDAHTTYVGSPTSRRTGFDVGVLTPAFPIDIGVLALSWLAVGVRGHVAYSETSLEPASTPASSGGHTTSYRILAYAEGSFRADIARPFLRVGGGISGVDTQSGPTSAQYATPTFGLYVGAHLFVDPAVSISPHLGLEYLSGTGHYTDSVTPRTFAYDYLQVFLGVELMGWIGGEPTPERSAAE